MEPATDGTEGSDFAAKARRYGPLGLLAVVAVVIIALVASGGGSDGDDSDEAAAGDDTAADDVDSTDDDTGSDDTGGDDSGSETTGDGETDLPDGVMSFSEAERLGLDIDFGERCDPETGRVRVPSFFAPECFAPYDGDNGGATAPGVTEDSIKIVWWIDQDSDPIMQFITDAILNDDTNADWEATIRALLEYYETYYETYGRSVDLEIVVGSGNVTDEVSARADAVKIAEEMDPFMVWGGPLLTSAFVEELNARGIPCIGCGPSQTTEYHQSNEGLFYSLVKSSEQLNVIVAEYIGKRLAGDPAIHAGDESMHGTERVFGRIWLESSAASVDQNEQFEAALAEYDVDIAESRSYALDPATLQESASTIIARMKEAGVTSVIINGDPVAPRELSREATAQDYHPEWILTGSALIDTAAFSRTYDQDQWAHAFGVSNLNARVDSSISGAGYVYEWFHGEPPAADDSIGVIDPTPGLFYAVLQGAGPDLTVQSFKDALFAGDPTRRAISAPSLDYGPTGRWPDGFDPDYFGVDDVTEVWWDPAATGPDEIDKEGDGLWRFVDGGTRYLWGEWPDTPPNVFTEEGTVTIYTERPPEEVVTLYEPLAPAGG